jgi:hypothetical protein
MPKKKTDEPQVKLPAKIRREVEDAMRSRARGSALEKEAKEIKTETNGTLLPILAAYEVSKYFVEGIGTCYKKVSSGSKIDGQKLLLGMLEIGIGIDDAKELIASSSNSWSTEYVEFRGAK